MPNKFSLLALVAYLAFHGAASPHQLMMVRGLDFKRQSSDDTRQAIDCPAGVPAGAICYAKEECPAGARCEPISGGSEGGDPGTGVAGDQVAGGQAAGDPAAGGQQTCPNGGLKDPETGRCITSNLSGLNGDAGVAENNQECPGGVPKNPKTGLCPKPAAAVNDQDCPGGVPKDPKTGQCPKPAAAVNDQGCPGGGPKDPKTGQCPKSAGSDNTQVCPGGVPKDPKTAQCPKPASSDRGQAAGTVADQGTGSGREPETSSNPAAGASGASGASSNPNLAGGERLNKCSSQHMQPGDGTIACTLKNNPCEGYNSQLEDIKRLGGNEQVYAVASLENSMGNCNRSDPGFPFATAQVPTDKHATKQSSKDGSRNCGPFNQNIKGIKDYCPEYKKMSDDSICQAFEDNARAVKCVLETTRNIGWLKFSQMHRCGRICDDTPDGGKCGPKPALKCKKAGEQYMGGVNHVAQVMLDMPGQGTVGGVFLDPI